MKDAVDEVAATLADLMTPPSPTLGLGLDGCIDEAPIFFGILTRLWPGNVIVITLCNDRAKAEADLANYGIRYSELVLVSSLAAKAKVIAEKGVLIYFDDQPETVKHVPSTVNVMLVRNGGNFEFDLRKWLLSKETGRLI
jgi:hypothetical protein